MCKKHITIVMTFIIILLSISVSAHPGSLDENGGHWNRKTGEYHYHTGEHTSSNSLSSSNTTAIYTGSIDGAGVQFAVPSEWECYHTSGEDYDCFSFFIDEEDMASCQVYLSDIYSDMLNDNPHLSRSEIDDFLKEEDGSAYLNELVEGIKNSLEKKLESLIENQSDKDPSFNATLRQLLFQTVSINSNEYIQGSYAIDIEIESPYYGTNHYKVDLKVYIYIKNAYVCSFILTSLDYAPYIDPFMSLLENATYSGMNNEVPPLLPEESTFNFVYIVFKSFLLIACLLLFIYIMLCVANHFDTSSKNSATSVDREIENNPDPIQGVENNASSPNKNHKNTPDTLLFGISMYSRSIQNLLLS